jgi:1,4-alpha-glucan branching enzyme
MWQGPPHLRNNNGCHGRKSMAKRNHTKNAAHQTGNGGTGNGRAQTFSFTAPTAMSVQLVGDFTHWQDQPVQMRKGADGIWRATVELPLGAHHYRFLVDGQWRDDPECQLRVPNPFGGEDAIRQVA